MHCHKETNTFVDALIRAVFWRKAYITFVHLFSSQQFYLVDCKVERLGVIR